MNIIYNKHTHKVVSARGNARVVTVDQERDMRKKYPWESMRLGDTFSLPNTFRIRNNLNSAVYRRWTQHLESYIVYQSDDRQTVVCERVA